MSHSAPHLNLKVDKQPKHNLTETRLSIFSKMLKVGELMLPGDTVEDLKTHNGVIILGPGLRKHTEKETTIIITRCGQFCHKPPNVYWVNSHQKRYVPRKGEVIVGVVASKRGDLLKVDIGASEHASLLLTAFEGATKKQKPDVQVGDVIYARLLSATREMEPELVCVDSYYKAGRLGILSDQGFLFNIDQDFAYRLLNYDNLLLRTLGQKMAYEIAVGMNGKVWVNARKPSDIDTVFKALLAAEKQTDQSIMSLCRK